MPECLEVAVDAELPEVLTEQVLDQLGFAGPPAATCAGLAELYAAWCGQVPFDNIRKRIHLASGDPGPLPGSNPVDFFGGWLRHGTGGTCWAGAGAFHALLQSLGFNTTLWIGTMLASPESSPNHGTVVVAIEGRDYLVDTSMLHGVPLWLKERGDSSIIHPAWGVRCHRREGRWHIRWRPLSRPEGFECRLERPVSGWQEFQAWHERTRAWGPFNYELAARWNRDQEVMGLALGNEVALRGEWGVIRRKLSHQERVDYLLNVLGLSEELATLLPDDMPTPPKPDSGLRMVPQVCAVGRGAHDQAAAASEASSADLD